MSLSGHGPDPHRIDCLGLHFSAEVEGGLSRKEICQRTLGDHWEVCGPGSGEGVCSRGLGSQV